MSGSLRDYMAALRARKQLLVVKKEVDPKFELHAVVRKVQAGPNLPVLFEKVRGTRYPVVSNLLGNYGIVAEQLGADIGRLAEKWAALSRTNSFPDPLDTDAAPAVFDQISLGDLPHLTFCEKDAGPYITAGVVLARDPDTGVVNLSFHRCQMIGNDELRCRLSTSGDLFRIQQKCEQRGQPLPATIMLGLPPAIMLAGATTVGPANSEYDLAARLLNRRIPIMKSPKHGLPIPASAQFVIEGEIAAGVRRPEGPFGEWMDYYVQQANNHVFEVQEVYAQKEAVFHAVGSGSNEELAISSIPIAGTIFNAVQTWVPNVADVTCFPLPQFCAIQLKNPAEGQPQRAMLAAFGAEMSRVLYVVVVDDDVNIHNLQDVLWAMATRCRPDKDIMQIPNVPSFARDPHRVHWGRLGIDATRPINAAADFERKKIPNLENVKLEDYLDRNS